MDWKEAYRNFDPMEPLKPGDPRLYPQLFGDFLRNVATRLLLNKDKNQKLLLSGHIGSGKSTFLNLLEEDEDIKKSFSVAKYSIKEIVDPSDANHIDLLLSITIKTTSAAYGQGVSKDEKLLSKLQEYADKLNKLIVREEEKTKTKKGALGLDLGGLIPWLEKTFLARYKVETETRERVRKYYKPRMNDFLQIINDILTRIKIQSEGKSLLILVDDTDKVPVEKALDIFYNNGQFLSEPLANIVFMVDTSLSCSTKYPAIRSKIGDEEFFPAIKIRERDGSSSEVTENNRRMFRDLVRKRIDKELINEEALNEAIEMSGGVVRELIRILNEAIFIAQGKVHKDHIDRAVINIRNSYNLYAPHVNILRNILSQPTWLQTSVENFAEIERIFLELLHMPALFQYRNGEDKWYRPYPIFIPWLERLKP